MSVNAKLLAVFQIERQIQGLSTRLRAAERFLTEQTRQVDELTTKLTSLESQKKQLAASVAERESEAARLNARLEELREKMNTAGTNREYQAFLGEINTIKDSKTEVDEQVLSLLGDVESIDAEMATTSDQLSERKTLQKRAQTEKAEREGEISSRMDELSSEREEASKDVPRDKLQMLESLVSERGDEAMASIEILDKRRHEVSCQSCMMAVPVEIVSSLMRNEVTMCPNCGVLLYIEEAAAAKLAPAKR